MTGFGCYGGRFDGEPEEAKNLLHIGCRLQSRGQFYGWVLGGWHSDLICGLRVTSEVDSL